MSPSGKAKAPITPQCPLLLGSASPRRRELLEQMGIPLIIHPPVVDEALQASETPETYLQRVVQAKLSAVAACDQVAGAAAWLCADTCVTADGKILGKPRDSVEAVKMLQLLVGRGHQVLTRYSIQEAGGARVERTIHTTVHMRKASLEELQRYVATGEGGDKAGSYAIQGIGAFLVSTIEGSYSNVVGLPICEVVTDLQSLGLLREFP